MLRGLLLFILTLSAAHATSVSPILHKCPVCGTKSVTVQLMSYSNFGEPARDLSDHPGFTFSDVEICPSDLYAGFPDTWKDMKPAEKEKLQEFLKSPSLRLTPQEKEIISGHENAFRDSNFYSLLWARSCEDFLRLSPRARFDRVLRSHYKGALVAKWEEAKEWEKSLAAHYREQAIAALNEARTADWSSAKDKRVFAYLHAEFTRQAGRVDEANALFQQVITAETALKDSDEETSWILEWAKEQNLRANLDAKGPDQLIAHILPELPDPQRDENAKENPRWPLHYAALDILAKKASSGDKECSVALWKLLDRKPERLVALLETLESQVSSLREVESRWADWFDEIQALLDKEQLPNALSKDPNPERIRNTLWHVVKSAVDGDKPSPWAVKVLLPEVRKCASAGGIPELKIQEKKNSYFSMLPEVGDEKEPKPDPVKSRLNELSRELYDLWKGAPADDRIHIARVYVRILQRLDDTYDSFRYPVMYFLPEIAETDVGRKAIMAEMNSTWGNAFWKAACAYAASMENGTEELVRLSSMPNVDDDLVAKLFLQKSDPSWKNAAVERLKARGYLSTSTYEYLASLNLPEINMALEEFAKRIRTGKTGDLLKDWPEGLLYTLRELDETKMKVSLKKIQLR